MGEFEQRSSDGGNWIITYSDLMTLLLVFFVMLYVLTPGIDASTFNDIISHFQSSTSVVFENDEAHKQSDNNNFDEEWKRFKQYLKEHGLESEVSVEKLENGVKITLRDLLTFNSGSATLLSRSKEVLEEIGGALTGKVKSIHVQGHTDNVPLASTTQFRSNWHLGAARAVSVVLYVKDNSKVHPARFQASSFGEFKPVATNETSEGRRKNRRVEIYVKYMQDSTAARDSVQVNDDVNIQE